MTAAPVLECGVLFNAFDGVQACGRVHGHPGAHTRDPLPSDRRAFAAALWRERRVIEAADKLLVAARDHERTARALRKRAEKMLNPPEGVHVEIWGDGRIVFVGPTVTA